MCRFTGYWIGVGSRISHVIGRGADDDRDDETHSVDPVEAKGDVQRTTELVHPTTDLAEERKDDLTDGDDDDDDEDCSSEDDDGPVEGLDKIKAGSMEECKLVSGRLPLETHSGPIAASLVTELKPERSRLTNPCRPSCDVAGADCPDRPQDDQGKDCRPVRVRPWFRTFTRTLVPGADDHPVLSRDGLPRRHATLACYKTLLASNPTLLAHWERTGCVSRLRALFSTAALAQLGCVYV